MDSTVNPTHLNSSAPNPHPICRVCYSSVNLRRCSNCKAAFYCSLIHQQTDWRNHRIECKQIRNHQNSAHLPKSQQRQPHQQTGQQTALADHLLQQYPIGDTAAAGAAESDGSDRAEWQNPLVGQHGSSGIAAAAPHVDTDAGAIMSQLTMMGDSGGAPGIGATFEVAAAQMQADREKKVRDFRNLSENTMRINDVHLTNAANLMASDIRDDLCKTIIADMNEYGLSVIDDFLGRAKGLDILSEVDNMYGAGVFRNGQLVSNSIDERNLKTIRGDKITWVKGTESGCINIGFLINQIDNLVISANKMRDNGSLGKYKIRERTKAMVACYPGSGAQYVMHVDNPNQDGRVITAIYYLNLDWDTQRSGGMLRIIPENGGATANIEPKFDRILFFWSDRRNPHEVQPAHHTRYAITVWYFDADEREAALQRFRQYQQSVT